MKRLILVAMLLFPAVSQAQASWMDDWTRTDRLLLAGYTAAWFLDYGQTRQIAVDPDYHETNGWLGPDPDQETVDAYFLGTYLLNLFVADTLSGPWRRGYLGLWTWIHFDCAVNNRRLGIRLNFNF